MCIEVIVPHLNVCVPLCRFLIFGLLPPLQIITSHFLKASVLTDSITVLLPHRDRRGQERRGNLVPQSRHSGLGGDTTLAAESSCRANLAVLASGVPPPLPWLLERTQKLPTTPLVLKLHKQMVITVERSDPVAKHCVSHCLTQGCRQTSEAICTASGGPDRIELCPHTHITQHACTHIHTRTTPIYTHKGVRVGLRQDIKLCSIQGTEYKFSCQSSSEQNIGRCQRPKELEGGKQGPPRRCQVLSSTPHTIRGESNGMGRIVFSTQETE